MVWKNPSALISPSITVQIGIALTLAVFVFTGAYWFVNDRWRAEIIFFGAAVAAAGQIAAAFYAGRTLRLANDIETRRLAVEERLEKLQRENAIFNFASRWNDASMVNVRIAFRDILTKAKFEKASIPSYIDGASDRRANVSNLLDFLEVLAVSITARLGDDELARRIFLGVVITAWNIFSDWIEIERKNRERPQLWVELETLYKRWSV